ncbi:MAG: 2-C-methyl-D-erythritol 4-phosphate cytidylyltransferase [Acidimicrobiia bacterium]|nr:2-C-methyl-D-erythritol 4-phosphate cytidylyltransferase [Acidimicrobiia bacterium]MDH4308131.1 2-C-methyl-D-erythritol 4-phosphate cytidylyltransferase [Acidimicrobiia bacterium]
MTTTTAAIVLAGGSGTRVAAEVNKVYLPIRDRDMLEYSLEAVSASPHVTTIVVVVREGDEDRAKRLVAGLDKPTRIVAGGRSRHRSEMAGLDALRDEILGDRIDLVAIHDGARPFITLDLLDRVVTAAATHGAAVPALPVEGTVFRTDGGRPELVPPGSLQRAQTPQVFSARPLLDAYDASIAADFEGVDTAETIERFTELAVHTVEGDPRNIKVTFVEDFFAAEDYALTWNRGAWG